MLMGGRRVRCRRTGLRSRTCSTCLQTSAGVECSLTPKGDLRANQGVMAMSREGASAPYWRYRSGSQKLTMSTSRTAERPPSVAPAIANRRTSLSLAEVGPARQGGFGSSGSDPFCVKKTQPENSRVFVPNIGTVCKCGERAVRPVCIMSYHLVRSANTETVYKRG